MEQTKRETKKLSNRERRNRFDRAQKIPETKFKKFPAWRPDGRKVFCTIPQD